MVLNMQDLQREGSKYATIWLNMSEQDVNMPEYVCIYDNRHRSEYLSGNT